MFLLVACQTTDVTPKSVFKNKTQIPSTVENTMPDPSVMDAIPALTINIPQMCMTAEAYEGAFGKFNEKIMMTWIVDDEAQEDESNNNFGILAYNKEKKTMTVSYTVMIVNKATRKRHERICIAMTGVNAEIQQLYDAEETKTISMDIYK